MTRQTYEEGKSAILKENQYTKEGYIFKGWSTSANGNVEYNNRQTVNFEGNVTLYAIWSKLYTVQYYANTTSTVSNMPNTSQHELNENILISNTIPQRKGYVFKGWSTNNNAGIPELNRGASITVNGNISLYAIWAIEDCEYILAGLDTLYDGKQNTSSGYSSNTTTWYDLSRNGNNWTISGAKWQGSGLYFDGSNDWVNMGQIQTGNVTDVTLETNLIINNYNTSNNTCIMGNWETGGGGIYVSSSGIIVAQFYIGGSYRTLSSNFKIEKGKEYTLTASYNGSTIKLYINGELKNTLSYSGAISKPGNSTVFALSCNPNGSSPTSPYLNGTIYSVRKYNRALNDTEIRKNYNEDIRKANSRYETEYVYNGIGSLYDGEQNTISGHSSNTTSWYDLSGNGNNGTINGATWQGNGLYFDGSNDWVNLGQIQTGSVTNMTWEVTFVANSYTSGEISLLANYDSGGGGINIQNGVLESDYYIGGGYRTLSSNVTVAKGELYTVSFTYSGSTLKIYVNGQLKNTLTYSGSISAPSNNTVLALGTNPSGSSATSPYFNGTIYAVRKYNRTLTDLEIQRNYNVDVKYR